MALTTTLDFFSEGIDLLSRKAERNTERRGAEVSVFKRDGGTEGKEEGGRDGGKEGRRVLVPSSEGARPRERSPS